MVVGWPGTRYLLRQSIPRLKIPIGIVKNAKKCEFWAILADFWWFWSKIQSPGSLRGRGVAGDALSLAPIDFSPGNSYRYSQKRKKMRILGDFGRFSFLPVFTGLRTVTKPQKKIRECENKKKTRVAHTTWPHRLKKIKKCQRTTCFRVRQKTKQRKRREVDRKRKAICV